MKNRIKICTRFFTVVVLLLLSMPSISANCSKKKKKEYLPGYVLTLKNDTIYGEICVKNDVKMCSGVEFLTKEGTTIKYKPNDLNGYHIDGNFGFKFDYVRTPKCFNCKKGFAKIIISGVINVYRLDYSANGGSTNYTASGNMVGSSYAAQTFYIQKGKVYKKFGKINFIEKLKEYCHDDSEILVEIEKLKWFEYPDFKNIISKYNENKLK